MTVTKVQLAVAGAIVLAVSLTQQIGLHAQTTEPKTELQPVKSGTKFHFDVIEMFDAKYQGDSPGFTGRAGALGGSRPHIALGDPVYRGEEKVGTITSAVWSRTQEGLTIEFDPEPDVRVCVGNSVWLDLNPATPAAAK